MSDYIDENFELDETDEYEGVNKNICNDFTTQLPNNNDIKQKTQINFPLKDNQDLKASYQYVDN